MNEPIDPRLRDALAGAAERGTPRDADEVVRAARDEAENPGLAKPLPLAARPARRPLVLTLASAAAVIAVLVGVVALAARNPGPGVGPDSSDDLLGYLRRSASGAMSSGSFRARMEFQIEGYEQLSSGVCTGGAATPPSGTLHLAADPDKHVVEVLDAPDGTVTTVNTGRSMVFNADMLPDGITSPAPWVRVDLDDPQHSEVSFAVTAGSLTAQVINPRDLLERIDASATSVTDLGTDEVDGVPVRHLRVSVDPAKLAMVRAEQQRRHDPSARTQGSSPPAEHLPTTVFETWIDDDGVLRRLDTEERMRSGVSGTDQQVEMRWVMQLHMFDYGTPLPMPIPDDNQMVAAGDLPATVLARTRAAGFCPVAVPTDVPAEVGDAMRQFDTCIAARVLSDLEGRLVKDVTGGSILAAESAHGGACRTPALETWCAQNPRVAGDPAQDARRRWCSGSTEIYVPDRPVPESTDAFEVRRVLTTPPPEALTPAEGQWLTEVLGGRSEDEARRIVESVGWTMRVTVRDRADVAVTMDRIPNRLNVAVSDGQVLSVLANG